MTDSLLDLPWNPLSPGEVSRLFERFPGPWCIAGGWALDLFAGRQSREHSDLDVLVARDDLHRLHAALPGWLLYGASGTLTPWQAGSDLQEHIHDIWCRRGDGPWEFQVMVIDMTAEEWVFRRDDRIRGPLHGMTQTTDAGIPFLAPEIQLLYKSKRPSRPKDEQDFQNVLPSLSPAQRSWLDTALAIVDPENPWRSTLPAVD